MMSSKRCELSVAAVIVHDIQSSAPLLLLAPDQCQVSTSQVYAIKIAQNCETLKHLLLGVWDSSFVL